MIKVLVVDDNPMDRAKAAHFLRAAEMEVEFAENGEEAVERLIAESIDVVVTDLQMPRMGGLDLVKYASQHHPGVPVILMTAFGNERVAIEALHAGAASYVSKKTLGEALVATVQNAVQVRESKRKQDRFPVSLTNTTCAFVLESHLNQLDNVIGFLQSVMEKIGLCDEADLIRVGTALHEALVNAHEHGNLELDSKLRDDEEGTYNRLAAERREQDPFRHRRVFVNADISRDEAQIRVRDEGPGFDPNSLPDPTAPESLERSERPRAVLDSDVHGRCLVQRHGQSNHHDQAAANADAGRNARRRAPCGLEPRPRRGRRRRVGGARRDASFSRRVQRAARGFAVHATERRGSGAGRGESRPAR